MSGLLKQLQKPKEGGVSKGQGLLRERPAAPPEPIGDGPITGEKAARLFEQTVALTPEELFAEDAKQAKQVKQTSLRESGETENVQLQRKRREPKPAPALIGGRDAMLPAWLKDGKKTSPQVELLVPRARIVLNDILPSDGEEEIDLGAAIRQAVDLAAETLSGELRISESDREQATEDLLSLLTGKGPIQPLYDDSGITDVFIDDHKSIRVIRRGQAMETPFYFRSKEEYRAFVNGMLQSVDRVLNLSTPIIDCVLDDEYRSRINAVDSSVLEGDEPRICIRIPRLQKVSFYDILQTKTLPATLAAWLAEVVAMGEANILVLGPTGSGKTVTTTALLSAVKSDERIITIEDVPEIFVPTGHLEKLVSRPANSQGEGEVKMPQLLRAALRRAPHRIVVGEIRDEEGKLFLRALETGHAGSIATIHAHNSRDSLWRLLDVVAAYESSPQESIMRRIGRSVDLTITQHKVDGKPCLMEIAEVRPPVDGEFVVQPLVKFAGVIEGKRRWQIMTQHSKWIDLIAERGIELKAGPSLLPVEASEKPRRASEMKGF